jgi:hypothetical protein
VPPEGPIARVMQYAVQYAALPPSARHTKEPRTGGPPGGPGGGESADPIFFAKVPSYISEGTKTGLRRASDPQGQSVTF